MEEAQPQKSPPMRKPYPGEGMLMSRALTLTWLVTTIGMLGVAEIDSRALWVQILYTVFTAVMMFFTVWSAVVLFVMLFDRDARTNSLIRAWTVVDLLIAYLISWANVLFLFWIWSNAPQRDEYTTGFHDELTYKAWLRTLHTASLLFAGAGFGRYVARTVVLEAVISMYILFNVFLFLIAVGTAVEISFDMALSAKKPKKT